ncbi:hypothetical protein ERJ75_000080300 [Trypanosoma vivax]|uniref:Uncharacterized protein n=1 Tax=Trypanosoma vivax (strain Y486) TaxID=1055687 RepID=F9WU68_TRYVY|nr:hypothetical protein ERJ75_000080300 [Trypanosoma vivax]CCD21116.1 hypothetical protein, conserved in T. vivax [Trypanosoma vivax Y486]|eukprot:CCD21116.1 hypothetical protein, conserved in T. vivax [Trypanosoma vivax Y486]
MLESGQLYVNETEAVSVSGDAISKMAHVLSNTSRALNVSRGFMDGTGRDFFNPFEAIKDDPNTYVYGHSNQNDEVMLKRASEVFAYFKNISKLYTDCNNKSGSNATVKSLEKKVMAGVDIVGNDLSTWNNQQVAQWKAAQENVPTGLGNMKNYTETSVKRVTNIWHYNVTIWDIIEKDCNRVHKTNSSGSSVGEKIVNSSRLNILRHLDDIANNATTESSIMENGCDTMYEHFRGYTSIINKQDAEKKRLLNDLCEKMEKQSKTMKNCTVNRTSLRWLEHRFNETVREMVERMNNSLTQLIDVEKEVLTKVGAMVVSKRDAICNDSKRLKSMNVTLRDVENKKLSDASSIYDLNASIAKAQSEAAKALGSSLASMGNISLIEMVADDSHTEISCAYHVRAEVERAAHKVSKIKMTAQRLLMRL